jgi:hypothetical protein
MGYKFKIDDKDSLEIVQGEDRSLVFRIMDEYLNPILLTAAVVILRMPRADGIGVMKRSTAKPTFTAAASTDYLTIADHGLVQNDKVQLTNSGGALPAGLSTSTDYYVMVVDADTIQLSASVDGAAVNITGAGTGTHTLDFAPLSISGTNHAVLGKAVLTLDENATLGLKAGEKQAIELEYTISGSTRVVQMSKALSVYEQVPS